MQDERSVRLEKLTALQRQGIDPYPSAASGRTALCAEARASFDPWLAEGKDITFAGRIMTTRIHGAMLFADIRDASGSFQIQLTADRGEDLFNRFRDLVDPGDIIQATGTLFNTKRGEPTLAVSDWAMLTKAILPLPEKWHGLQDVETRYREREIDLIANEEVRNRFIVRSKLVSSLRRFLDAQDFLEVETPILQSIPGGANARPFITHHQALDIDLYLRIAPELYLKRLIVGGFEKVYEIGRSFRNEGIDYAHNPEFTTIELYWAFVEKDRFVTFMEEMVTTIVEAAVGSTKVPYEQGELDFTAPWKKTTFREAVRDACGIDIDDHRTADALVAAAHAKGLSVDFSGCVGIGEHYDQLFKKTARAGMTQPTWVFDYPVDLKPLAKRSPADPSKSACVQLVVQGAEIINAYYHELNDPVDQRERFQEQERMRVEGSEEAQRIDEPFLRALEHGMPPTSGMAIGIDRLVAFITDSPNLKEVILFPTLRPESGV
ncbi:MAG: hypothetical protein RL141_754 [Candidatus Parcubacteria bacterium]|jgi:lysyl-tRNA synthetase class 2